MSVSLSAVFNGYQSFLANGLPNSGGSIAVYLAGTTTPATTYTTSAAIIPNSNPIILSAGGTPPSEIWLTDGIAYKFVVLDMLNVPVPNGSFDNITGVGSGAASQAFAGANGSSLIGFQQAGSSTLRTAQDKMRESLSVADFGAKNDSLTTSATSNRIAIQAAVDAANVRGGGEVVIGGGGVYYVDFTNYYRDVGTLYGVTSVKLKDNVSIKIEQGTTIRLIPNAYGANTYYRMFSSGDETRLSNAMIYGGGTLDGNSPNQLPQPGSENCSNIQLEVKDNVHVHGIRSINAYGMGIQLRGDYALGVLGLATHMSVFDCHTENVSNIGIQCGTFSGLVIHGNTVATCVNNGIDVYGNDGTTTCLSYNFAITGNTINNALTGVFLETVRDGTVSGNAIYQCTYGTIVNRINGEPRGLAITGNSIRNCTYGARFTGDMGGVLFSTNAVTDFSAGGAQLGSGTVGSVSYVTIRNNLFVPVSNAVATIPEAGAQSAFNLIQDNVVKCAAYPQALLYVGAAISSVDNQVGGFRVLPAQVGPDVRGSFGQFASLELLNGRFENGAGPALITIPDNTGGTVTINSRQSGVGRSKRVVSYIKAAGVLTILSQPSEFVTAEPTAACTVASNNLQVNFVAGANNYARWGYSFTGID